MSSEHITYMLQQIIVLVLQSAGHLIRYTICTSTSEGLPLLNSITFIGHNHDSYGSAFTEGFAYNFMPGDHVILKIVGLLQNLNSFAEFTCHMHVRFIHADLILMLNICLRWVGTLYKKITFSKTDTDVSDKNFYTSFLWVPSMWNYSLCVRG